MVAIAFLSVSAVAVISVLQGGGSASVSYPGTGRPAVFLPIAYVSIVVVGVVVGAVLLVRRFLNRKRDKP